MGGGMGEGGGANGKANSMQSGCVQRVFNDHARKDACSGRFCEQTCNQLWIRLGTRKYKEHERKMVRTSNFEVHSAEMRGQDKGEGQRERKRGDCGTRGEGRREQECLRLSKQRSRNHRSAGRDVSIYEEERRRIRSMLVLRSSTATTASWGASSKGLDHWQSQGLPTINWACGVAYRGQAKRLTRSFRSFIFV